MQNPVQSQQNNIRIPFIEHCSKVIFLLLSRYLFSGVFLLIACECIRRKYEVNEFIYVITQ